jgi:hypothetical protein
MYFLKNIATNSLGLVSNYTRFGCIIPAEEVEVESLEKFFKKSKLKENELLEALRADSNVVIETPADRSARIEKEKPVESKLEKKVRKDDKIRAEKKKLDKANEEIEEALKTPSKEDDKIAKEKAEKIAKKINEVKKNG